MCDLSTFLLGIQDAAYVAQNVVQTVESLGLGSCFTGATPYHAKRIIEEYALPSRVFPLVQLVVGHPAEDRPPRPRDPIEFSLFEDRHPELGEASAGRAMAVMGEGYLVQGYYRTRNSRSGSGAKRRSRSTTIRGPSTSRESSNSERKIPAGRSACWRRVDSISEGRSERSRPTRG